jgi:hypothetical protein
VKKKERNGTLLLRPVSKEFKSKTGHRQQIRVSSQKYGSWKAGINPTFLTMPYFMILPCSFILLML